MAFSQRQLKINQYVQVQAAKILEVGALDNPTYSRPHFNVKYLDFASTDELAKKAESNPRYSRDRLVEVDYVCPTPSYSQYIHEKFDLVVANHVVEHVPDSIRWFQEIYKVMNAGGFFFLSVPDRRYTFDIARRTSDFIDILRNYREQVQKPDFYHILRHFYYHKPIKAADVWQNDYEEKMKQMRFDNKTAIEVAEKHAKAPYSDVHCHVFTSDSFREAFEILIDLKYIPLQIEEITQPVKMSNEFYAVFSKPK
jgi:SAM-dependent methyltransferase